MPSIGKVPNVIRRKTQGGRVYYFGSIPSDKIKAVTVVPVVEASPKTPLTESTELGYQRPGAYLRMNKFRSFLKENEDSYVPPILLSGRGKWIFKRDQDDSEVGELEIVGSAAIIDGQHRVGGYVLLFENDDIVRSIDFVLLEDLDLEQEVREFVTVNNNQVGVPKSLHAFLGIDIEGMGAVSDQADETWIAWQLNMREDSPFQGKITRTKMGPEHLFQLHSVSKNIARTFKHGAFIHTDREEKLDITIKYWNLILEYHPKQWADIEKLGVTGQGRKAFDYKLLELTGFIAWSLIGGSDILNSSYNSASHTMDWDRVQAIVELFSNNIEWGKSEMFRGLTGEVGGKKIQEHMQEVLSGSGL
jgi:DNA sulfur modification protein DndB